MAPLSVPMRTLPVARTALRRASPAQTANATRTCIAATRAYHPTCGKIRTLGATNGLQSTVTSPPAWGGQSILLRRGYADLNAALTASPGRSEADLLVEELEELYEAAKDEFEIATDSTEAGTIYAASDRAAARDALNHLTRIYTLYTEKVLSSWPEAPPASPTGTPISPRVKEPVQQDAKEGKVDPILSGDPAAGPPLAGKDASEASVDSIVPNYDPEIVPGEVREEVKKRVGQRVRELQIAVKTLEEKGKAQ